MATDGDSGRITPMPGAEQDRSGKLLVIPPSGGAMDDDVVRALCDADQR